MTVISPTTAMQSMEMTRPSQTEERSELAPPVEVAPGQSVAEACGGIEVVEHLVLWGLPREECDEAWFYKTHDMADWRYLEGIPDSVEQITCKFGWISLEVLDELLRVSRVRHLKFVNCAWDFSASLEAKDHDVLVGAGDGEGRAADNQDEVSNIFEAGQVYATSTQIREMLVSQCCALPPNFFLSLPQGVEELTMRQANLWTCDLDSRELEEVCPNLSRLFLGFQDIHEDPEPALEYGDADNLINLLQAMPEGVTELNLHYPKLYGRVKEVLRALPNLKVLRIADPDAMLSREEQRFLTRYFLKHPELRIEMPRSAMGEVNAAFADDKQVCWV